ncbi:ABC transporter permease [Actinomycetospora sp. NBRC 106375]|uniref:ABC transporter permease n=1 Tax=Actinomycetospora sp. NBRC 106375 TaxID=3032207 RepID=UPI0024A3650A|nr:ABC transporter permease [Actinomycetospora sp. NBRC 106375]GLZ44232.1 ABC transporter permease [Actinomycetospora sp. NBRC 106375]
MSTTSLGEPRTLPVRVELARQWRRRRTQVTLGLFALLPVILWIAFSVGDAPQRGTAATSLTDLAQASGPNFAVFALFSSASFLFVVVVALFFGDTVASEASWSSLRYLLAIPVPRVRLLRQKTIVAALLSLATLVVLPVVAIVLGTLVYGAGDYLSPTGESLPYGTALVRILLAVAYLAIHLLWVAGVATLFSVLTDAPLGAVGGAVLVSILSQILDTVDALGSLRNVLPTHDVFAFADLLTLDVDGTDLARGVLSALVWCIAFGATAVWYFRRKDITS